MGQDSHIGRRRRQVIPRLKHFCTRAPYDNLDDVNLCVALQVKDASKAQIGGGQAGPLKVYVVKTSNDVLAGLCRHHANDVNSLLHAP